MDAGTLSQKDTVSVNEQVIVMSGRETIRVLEVAVDTPTQATGTVKAPEMTTISTSMAQSEVMQPATFPSVQAVCSLSQATTQQQQTIPLTMQAAPQILTHENLATILTGVMAPTGTVTQPLLIPLGGQVPGQQGLAVLTIPTATMTTLPGLTGTSQAGGVLKFPVTGLQASVLNASVQQQLQQPPQSLQPQAVIQAPHTLQTVPPVQIQHLIQHQGGIQAQPQLSIQSQPTETPTSVSKPLEVPSQITVQPAGLTINPTVISAASLGGQNQFLSSVATPVITNTIPGLQGITSQILTNSQGQVIGTIPLMVNSNAVTTSTTAPATFTMPNLQLQTVTPQLLLNSQGQVIATLASSPIQPLVLKKQPTPESPVKAVPQPIQPAPTIPQVSVVLTPSNPVTTVSPTPVPITSPEMPTVGQLISKPQTPTLEDEGINLEEIREFAKNFKIRRLSLGLTQTQVGQALTATEGPAYSQSAICRFEKLDITPKSAQKLKPVLEKWLNEAELRNQAGQQNLMEFVGGEPSKKRKRRTSFTPQAIETLNAYFEKNALPTGQEITEIAKELNYDREVVRVWFCNRRQTLKNTSKLNVFQIP
ncbi:POU domain, class 6, transcription factor 1 isoform X2 [Protopterus annectens]|uniref:POU domain, class 6, transcription factor 1 isoform X2 n=1 Tax=Protopterus annectens TaxID=7888 RepID=UPI001CFAAB0F|nr:POU domain, class 6, transcription factor 1 isoform X2 [Protopterus annectens]